jgi:hypothetical protein
MRYYHTTGISEDQVTDLTIMVKESMTPWNPNTKPHLLGLRKQIIVTLIWLRQNMTQDAIADMFDVSQPTISRIASSMRQCLLTALGDLGISLDEAAATRPVLVDGTYVRTGNRHGVGHQLYSGKRGCQCVNVQVACDLAGRFLAASSPQPGARHDRKCLELAGWEEILENMNWVADSGYIGTDAITPIRKKPGMSLTGNQKEFNHEISRLRCAVERCIAHWKNWKILKTGYRGRLRDLASTIALVTQLELYKQGW